MLGLTWVDGLIVLAVLVVIAWLIRRVLGRRSGRRDRTDDDDWGSRLIQERGDHHKPPRS